MLNNLYLDIETVADTLPEKLQGNLEGKIKINAKLKDQDKIDEDYNKKLSDLVSDFPLSPLTGKVICFGWALGQQNVEVLCLPNETTVLVKASEILSNLDQADTIVTFSGKSFDIPYIRIRCAILGIPLRLPRQVDSKYDQTTHFDVRSALTNFEQYGKGSLEDWALRFGIEVNGETKGKDIAQLYNAGLYGAIAEHCRQDITITRKLHLALINYFK